jgi:uncharacterized protein (TIGR02001 family)
VKITTKVALIAFTGLTPFAAFAEDSSNPLPGTVTGNIALTNNYIFRGVTQTNNHAAVQGGLDWDTGLGLHFGAWASSLNFNDGNQATTEVDLYAGYAGKIDNFSYDAGFMYYWYPGAANALGYDFWELYGKVGYDFGVAAVSGGIAYTPNNTVTNLDATYVNAVLTVPVVDIFSVSAGVGYYFYDSLKDQTDWNIGGTFKVYNWFDVDARYYNTDNKALGNFADEKFVVKISRAF